MANAITQSGEYREYARIDTAPGAGGYWTNAVSISDLKTGKSIKRIFFSIREEQADPGSIDDSDVTVTLQFRCTDNDRWTDYVFLDGSTLAIGNRLKIDDDGAAAEWRAGVKEGDYTSGSVLVGFDW